MTIKGFLRNISTYFLREQFNPSFVGLLINPFYFSRKALYQKVRKYSCHIKGKTLDIGCGTKPYQHIFNSEQYVGIDVISTGHNHATSKVDVFYEGDIIPFKNQSFDSIVCFEVLQAVFTPDKFLEEANRVLKNGGTAIFTVPFFWDECEQPYDYARYTSFGLKYIFEKHGFIVVKNDKLLCDLRLLALLLNAYLDKVVRRYIRAKLRYFFLLPFTSINNLLGYLLMFFPGNIDMYFGNVLLLKKQQGSNDQT